MTAVKTAAAGVVAAALVLAVIGGVRWLLAGHPPAGTAPAVFTPVAVSGVIQSSAYHHVALAGTVWTGKLDSGGRVILISNGGLGGCAFGTITDGDQVTVAAGADLGALSPADVTVNGTSLTAVTIAGGC